MNSRAPTPLDQFEFTRNIGKGSYGEVTLARHKRDRKQYVLKKINLQKASARERRSAEQEAKLLSKLKHPNIVSYKDSFEKDGYLYIAMQYCEGGDLYNKLKEQRGTLLEERQLVEWFVQIAMAMQYMHERNILHRDLKTQNIFLTKSKIIKVGDLGIARVLDSSADMATTLIGTPYYMSPELFSNKPYNHKSDVWALGCCVYEMTTLKHAFNAKDMNSLVYKILRGKMPPMPKQYSCDLVDLIRVMLHQDPAKRPTVNRILRDPYIKKNIALFLEETKQSRRPASASSRGRPSSASSQRSAPGDIGRRLPVPGANAAVSQDMPDSARSVASVSKVDIAAGGDAPPPPLPQARPMSNHRRRPSDGVRPDLQPIKEAKADEVKKEEKEASDESEEEHQATLKAPSVKEKEPPKPSSPTKNGASNPKKKKKSVLSKYARPESDRPESGSVPKPVDKPRPLPMPPKVEESRGLPQRRENRFAEENNVETESKSSSSSSKEDNMSLGDETPRSLPNLSAREKRRRNQNAQSYDNPNSARIILVKDPPPPSSRSTVITKSERTRYDPKPNIPRQRQPSLADDSSSSDEDTLKGNEDRTHSKEKERSLKFLTETGPNHRKHNHQHRHTAQLENKEMKNFITLLDTTLQLNRDDDKSDEELQEVKVTEETPRIPKSSSMPSVETLCNADRLMSRIQQLHTDCMKGVGYNVLKEAFEILSRIEEDEVEPKLMAVMGREKFDLYAGKIWQLKFCEDMARIGVAS